MSKKNLTQATLWNLGTTKRSNVPLADDGNVSNTTGTVESTECSSVSDTSKDTIEKSPCSAPCCVNFDKETEAVQIPVGKHKVWRIYGKKEESDKTPKSNEETEKGKKKEASSERKRYWDDNWFSSYKWLVLCHTADKPENKRAFCSVCRFAVARGLVTSFSNIKVGEKSYSIVGSNDWKNCPANFKAHEDSDFHAECSLKSAHQFADSVHSQILKGKQAQQQRNQVCMLRQLSLLRGLARQGLPIRGHTPEESNYYQLMLILAENDEEGLKSFISKGSYSSPQVTNEILELMYKQSIRALLDDIRNKSNIFAITVDETSDISGHEQLVLCIRWVSDDYEINEDFIGLYKCKSTDAQSIKSIIDDILLRCSLDIMNCRGQTYDGASVLQGAKTGVAKRIKDVNPKALSMHCVNHSLNLPLQEVGVKYSLVKNALCLVKEIGNIIRLSPKRLDLFKDIQNEFKQSNEGDGGECSKPNVNLKPLCPTRWTARHGAIKAVLDNYPAILKTLEVIVRKGGSSEGERKAPGVLALMKQFETYLGLRVSLQLFSVSEEAASQLQKVSVTAEQVQDIISTLKNHYTNQRNEAVFGSFFSDIKTSAANIDIEDPKLPRKRRAPSKVDERPDTATEWSEPEGYYRRQYFEVIDSLIGELDRRFDQETLNVLKVIESLIVNSCNGHYVEMLPQELKIYERGQKDFETDRLLIQLKMLPDLLKTYNEKFLSDQLEINRIFDFVKLMKKMKGMVGLFSEVNKLLKLYLVIPMSNATAERSFSGLRRMKTYLRNTMTEKRLNHLMFLNAHKNITDLLDLKRVLSDFVLANDRRMSFFGNVVCV